MQVILLERVGRLGAIGSVVKVRPGFARNYLLPQGKALRATRDNLGRFEAQRAHIEARNLELKAEAQTVAEALNGQIFVVIRQAGDGGHLYGSVAPRDIAEAAQAAGVEISRTQIALDKPIKNLGVHPVSVQLHPEVFAEVSVNVARSQDEAALQASGKTVAQLRAEEEAAAAAEFDVKSLFDPDEARGDDDDR
ncbi:50S ribosomal protein L9 [Neomegalonema sp.]|uniref:50S ribosomal protein L9 n=1 Tax=Neomegalonema sp. TaxID=2039713 RepID=UPI002621EE44|nr:50S ribosomal protein L9 [Neomegalonema sp.]MDD2870291.1 50S ribosomal protein L9 [Neomegalonema sp.]